MNIIDAIKSGKKFQRQGDTSLYLRMLAEYPDINISAISRDDFLADNWEIEQKSVTITREQFDAAWSKIWPNDPQFDFERNLIAEELGL